MRGQAGRVVTAACLPYLKLSILLGMNRMGRQGQFHFLAWAGTHSCLPLLSSLTASPPPPSFSPSILCTS